MSEQLELTEEIFPSLLQWFYKNQRILPWRENKEAYRIWVSEIMLQQTRVEAVKPYYNRFMKALPTVKDLASAKEDDLLKLWEGLGYYNRVRNMQKAAQIIMKDYAGEFPTEYDMLLKLPGIGSYTAGAIASIAYSKRVPAVDGNVLRILSRLCMYKEDVLKDKTKKAAEKALIDILPEDVSGDVNQALMELGATVCVPNGEPHCKQCPWNHMCLGRKNNCQMEYPYKSKKKPRIIEEKTVLLIMDDENVLIHKRPKTGLLRGLYEFPNVEGYLKEEEIREVVRGFGLEPLKITFLKDAKHIFSHKEWHMKAYCIKIEPYNYNYNDIGHRELEDSYKMVNRATIEEQYAIPSAFAAFTPCVDIKIGIQK